MADESHVSRRDGHLNLGGPRLGSDVPPEPRAPRAPASAEGVRRFVNDASTVGKFEVDRKTFESISGNPSPRERLGRGEGIDGKATHSRPGDKLESGVPAPID